MRFNRTQLLDRTVQKRDARLFLIATEGERTEPDYFHELQSRAIIDRSRTKIEVIPTSDGSSAPEYVLGRLNAIASRYQLADFDRCWLVIDYDRWGGGKLAQVTQLASQKAYATAVSRPCFELWLILHVTDDHGLTATSSPEECKARWRAVRPASQHFPMREQVGTAIDRAQALEPSAAQAQRWPAGVGTRVFQLVSELLGR